MIITVVHLTVSLPYFLIKSNSLLKNIFQKLISYLTPQESAWFMELKNTLLFTRTHHCKLMEASLVRFAFSYLIRFVLMFPYIFTQISLLNSSYIVRFEVFTVVTMKNAVFWGVATCGSCKSQHFTGTYCLHHQGEESQRARNSVPLKHRFLEEPHGMTPRKLYSSSYIVFQPGFKNIVSHFCCLFSGPVTNWDYIA
jgi:hypothetical protein